MSARFNANELTEILYDAVDTIVKGRIESLLIDTTITATIVDTTRCEYGEYRVTTDDSISFLAYSDNVTYKRGMRVYVRVPGGDYTKQKIITGRYIEKDRKTPISNIFEEKANEVQRARESYLDYETSIMELEKQYKKSYKAISENAELTVEDRDSKIKELTTYYTTNKKSLQDQFNKGIVSNKNATTLDELAKILSEYQKTQQTIIVELAKMGGNT